MSGEDCPCLAPPVTASHSQGVDDGANDRFGHENGGGMGGHPMSAHPSGVPCITACSTCPCPFIGGGVADGLLPEDAGRILHGDEVLFHEAEDEVGSFARLPWGRASDPQVLVESAACLPGSVSQCSSAF